MEIIITSATAAEVAPLKAHLSAHWVPSANDRFTLGQTTVEFAVTGVGMVRTAFHLGQLLARSKPQLCINAGIAGAFPGKFEIGNVVHVIQECIPELGARNAAGTFLSLNKMGLDEDINSYELLNTDAAQFNFLPTARGITVNTVHGDTHGIDDIIHRFDPDIETMEGAAFFYSCLRAHVPFLAIRSISNMVEPRNKDNWNVQMAISNLNAQLVEMLELLKS